MVLHNINDIFVYAFHISNVNEKHQVLDQLMYIVDNVQIEVIETNYKIDEMV
jgi:hypothetical protein